MRLCLSPHMDPTYSIDGNSIGMMSAVLAIDAMVTCEGVVWKRVAGDQRAFLGQLAMPKPC